MVLKMLRKRTLQRSSSVGETLTAPETVALLDNSSINKPQPKMAPANEPVKVQRMSESSVEYYQRNNNFLIRHQKWIWGLVLGVFVVAVILLCLGLTGNLGSSEVTTPPPPTTIVYRPERTTPIPPTTPLPPPSIVEPDHRIDCAPNMNNAVVRPNNCAASGWNAFCQYENHTDVRIPKCYFDPARGGFRTEKLSSGLPNIDIYSLTAIHPRKFGLQFAQPRLTVERKSGKILRVKFDNAAEQRYEVPVPLKPIPYDRYWLHDVTVPATTTGITVQRRSTGVKIWDLSLGGLMLEHQFLQFTTKLPSENCYGFGDNRHHSFKHKFDWKLWPMFSRDQAPTDPNAQHNLYGVHPFYMCIEADGNAHGVLLLNSNAMEYKFQPAPALTLRSFGGILDFYIFMGPTPENVIQQYTQLTGRTFIPPYWALGFQISRWGFESLDIVKNVVQRNVDKNIPLDAVYGDIDYMRHRQDFTLDKDLYGGLPEYINQLHNQGMKYVIILDPAIHVDAGRLHPNDPVYEPHIEAVRDDVYIKWPNTSNNVNANFNGSNKIMLGKVWPDGRVAFPDFFKESTKAWWTRWINYTYHDLGIKFDALWIDMNEVSSWDTNKIVSPPCHTGLQGNHECQSLQCPGGSLESPIFKPAAITIYGSTTKLSDKTLCMTAEQELNGVLYQQYNVHSLYGWSQAKVTYEAAQSIRGERSFVFSRSTYPTGQQYVGHWLGDNAANFNDLKHSIIGLLEYSLFGYAYVGSDICGFFDNTTTSLCSLWSAAGAFYPFSRNHNALGAKEQDPGNDPVVAKFARVALTERYRLLPYLYTLFYKAHVYGDTVSRPLHHIYPTDATSLETDTQFFWGDALMISPILDDDSSRSVYMPPSEFYNYYDGTMIGSRQVNFAIDPACFSTSPECPGAVIALHLRAGHIVPVMDPSTTTEESRKNPLRLLIATSSTSVKSSGELFWDDGKSIDTYENANYYHAQFTYDSVTKTLDWTVVKNTIDTVPILQELLIYSQPQPGVNFDIFINGQLQNNAAVAMSFQRLSVSLPSASGQSITSSFQLQLRERSTA